MPGWLRSSLRSVWLDVAIAAALFALGQVEVWSNAEYQGSAVFPGPAVLNSLLTVPLLTLPLVLRRRRPLLSLTLVFAAVATASATLGGAEAATEFLAALISLYSAAANFDRRYVVLTIAWAGMAVHEVRDASVHGIGDVVWGVGMLAAAWFFGLSVRSRQWRLKALEAEARRLEMEREQHAREAVAAEQRRLAQELHDVIAHAVSVVVVQAQAGQRLVGRDEQALTASLQSIEVSARGALIEMRRLLTLLRSAPGSDLAPAPGLEQLDTLTELVGKAGLQVEIETIGEPDRLPAGLDLSAFRIVQEALTNALKHGRSRHARVMIAYRPHELELEITDDGRAGPPKAEAGSGNGLLGMRERVGLYGGDLAAGPLADGGWRVQARLPIDG